MSLFGKIVSSLLNENYNNKGMRAEFVDADPKKGVYIYHCTPTLHGISKTGARRQWNNSFAGNLYGDALYATYTLQSARRNWTTYAQGADKGMIKMICHSDLRQFVIFDPTVCAQVHGREMGIDEQLAYIFRDNKKLLEYFTTSFLSQGYNSLTLNDVKPYFKHAIDDTSNISNYTSIGAQRMWKIIDYIETTQHVNLRGKYIKGLIYSGRNDGNCLIPYDFASVEPIAVSTDGGYHFNPIDTNSWLHTELMSDNVDLQHNLKYIYDYFRTEGFANGYAIVGKGGKYQILNQKLFQQNQNGKICDLWFDEVDGQTFNTKREIVVKYKGSLVIIKAVTYKTYNVYDMDGHYLCNLNDLDNFFNHLTNPQTNIKQTNRVRQTISDDDLDNF